MTSVSPLAPDRFPDLPPIAGVRLAPPPAASAIGPRRSDGGRAGAGQHDSRRPHPLADRGRAGDLVPRVPAGRQGARDRRQFGQCQIFTGRAGKGSSRARRRRRRELLGCDPREIFISSTGVIGEPPPAEKIVAALPRACRALGRGWEAAARAIMTTDTFPKGATATAAIDGVEVRLNGFAKGSGMIAPDMATMLAYVFTDAALPAAVLQRCSPRRRSVVQLDHRRRRHLDQRHGAALRDAAGAARPVIEPGRSAAPRFRRALDG